MFAKSGDLAAILTNLEANDVLFIDEIHRLNPAIEEVLYSAMEDFQLDLIIGEGPSARSVKIDLQPFTLVGATTRSGLLSTPLRERFGIPLRLEFYSPEDLQKIVLRGAKLLNVPMSEEGAAGKSPVVRGDAAGGRPAVRRVRDFGAVAAAERLTRRLPTALYAGSMWTNSGWTRLTNVISAVLPAITAAVRSEPTRLPRLCRKNATRLKKWWNRFC